MQSALKDQSDLLLSARSRSLVEVPDLQMRGAIPGHLQCMNLVFKHGICLLHVLCATSILSKNSRVLDTKFLAKISANLSQSQLKSVEKAARIRFRFV